MYAPGVLRSDRVVQAEGEDVTARIIAMILAGLVFAGAAAGIGWTLWYAFATVMRSWGAPNFIVVLWSIAVALASVAVVIGALIHIWEEVS